MGKIEGEGGRFDPTSQQIKPTEQHKPHQEGDNGAPGLPRTVHESAKPPPEGRERQPLPNVWDVLEGQVRIHEELSAHRITFQEYMYKRERRNLIDLEDEIAEKGTSHDKLILKLHNSVVIEPTGTLPNPVTFRELTLEEFQQFRSKVEPMSEEEITEEIRKAKEEFERKSASKPKPNFPKGGPRV